VACVAESLQDRMSKVHDIDGFPLTVVGSIGFTVGPGPDATASSM